jgi:hypothetical protein
VSKTLFKIEAGVFGLALVDTAAVGYLPTWQAPMGGVLPDVALADYDPLSDGFSCQVVTGVLTATENVTTENIDGTWCDLPSVAQIVGEDSFAVAWDAYQDPNDRDGLTAYCYQHRGEKAYVYFGAGGDAVPPTAIGVVTIKAMGIGGGRTAARSQVTFPFDRAPDIQFGTTTSYRIVFGDKATPPVLLPITTTADADDGELVDAS